MFKSTAVAGTWSLFDTMRGMVVGAVGVNSPRLRADASNAESSVSGAYPTSDGFHVNGLSASATYIYMAIRAPMMVEPESGTEVFAVDQGDGTSSIPDFTSGFPVDMALRKRTSSGSDGKISARLTGAKSLVPNSTAAEAGSSEATFDWMEGWCEDGANTSTDTYSWMFKRAKGFFDVVAYTGDSTAGRTVNHSLGVAPEMMIVKRRNTGGNDSHWTVYHHGIDKDGDGLPATDYILLDSNGAAADYSGLWNDTAPSSSVFTLGSLNFVNYSGDAYIAYLFATLDGVSKVGSYTGNGSSQTIDCGFSAGARFVLIKRTDNSGNWKLMDTTRGITTGDDKVLELDSTSAESTFDLIDPASSGFIVKGNTTQGQNQSSATYIFLAIA